MKSIISRVKCENCEHAHNVHIKITDRKYQGCYKNEDIDLWVVELERCPIGRWSDEEENKR